MMIATPSPQLFYQVGGSLPSHAATYVRRQADETLFTTLQQGQFCYVFNARQMGKSSLRIQTTQRLQAEGVRCGVIDITTIGSREITPEQWYASIAGLLTKTFRLDVSLAQWWRDRTHLSLIARLSEFLETVLLAQIADPIVLFIDEIDSVLSLPFSTDDFFALLRACYNRRAEQSSYQRLTFALFGVATPTELIADTTRTPFNIGQAIELRGFQRSEVAPLLPGLSNRVSQPEVALDRILDWTGGQPFLTQKLCQLVQYADQAPADADVAIRDWIDTIVHQGILKQWESQDEPEHLKTIRDRLLYSEQKASRLLGIYQQILLQDLQCHRGLDRVPLIVDDSPTQKELLLTGLVEKYHGQLRVKNPIYRHVFNLEWTTYHLDQLRPYDVAFTEWSLSGYQDESRLLRGQALRDALVWSQGKSLSDLDYQFLAASQECDRRESQRMLEAERLQEVEARLAVEHQRSLEQRRHLRRQRVLLAFVSLAMLIAMGLGLVAYRQYQQTALSELKAIVLSSEALFASNKSFNALLQAIKAKERSQHMADISPPLQTQVDAALWRVMLSIQQENRLDGHTAAVLTVDFSPDGQTLATAGVDGTVKLWRTDGHLLQTLKGNGTVLRSLKFSPDGSMLAAGGDSKTVQLWYRQGSKFQASPTHIISTQASGTWSLTFSTDSSTLLLAGPDSSVELWQRQSRQITTLPGKSAGMRSVACSPDGQIIVAGNSDTTLTYWQRDTNQPRVLRGHQTSVEAIAFHPKGTMFASGSVDGTLNLWSYDGTLIKTIPAHTATIRSIAFSRDGQFMATGSHDKTVKLWTLDGRLLSTLKGHDAAIWGIALSPDGRTLASSGADNTTLLWQTTSRFQRTIYGVADITLRLLVTPDGSTMITVGNDKTIKLWQLDGAPLRTILAHDASTGRIDLSPDGKTLASVSEDRTLKLWHLDGTLLQTFKQATTALIAVSWHPNGTQLVASSADGSLWLWRRDGTLIKRIKGHAAPAWDVKFSPDGQLLASASNDQTVQLRRADGTLIKTLKDHTASVWQVAFSPDGQLLASGSGDATVKLWHRDGTLAQTLRGHKAAVWGIAFSPDGSLIATASVDQTVKLWRADGTLLATLEGHQSGVRAVAFHPHQPLLVSAADDQTMMVWNVMEILKLNPLVDACAWVRDYLTTNPQAEPLCQS